MASSNLRAWEMGIVTQIGSMIMESAKTLSSWSANISSGFHLGIATEIPNGVMITIGNKAKEAHAFEHGSGIHGETGEKYIIQAVNAPLLVFPGTHEFEGQIIKIPLVHHPGVGARPFMQPAVEANREKALALLGPVVREAIKLTIQEAWKNHE